MEALDQGLLDTGFVFAADGIDTERRPAALNVMCFCSLGNLQEVPRVVEGAHEPYL